MMDFGSSELHARTVWAEKERQAREAAASSHLRGVPLGFRASLAARLARLALRLDRETTGSLVAGEFKAAGHRS